MQRAVEDIGIKGERYLGSQFFPQTQLAFQTGGTAQIGRPGQYGFAGTESRQLFRPQGGVTGNLERERLTEEERRRRELESTERSFRGTLYS